MKLITYSVFPSPFGNMAIAKSDVGICRILFPEDAPFDHILSKIYQTEVLQEPRAFQDCIRQLKEYFDGKRRQFDLPIDLQTTPFYKKALTEVQNIPYGKTASYGEIAIRIQNPKAARAVGTANAQNPIPIIIPCHRVISHDGSLGGYGGKLERKMFLLELEGVYYYSGDS